jgi:5-methylcytosine-specific restriction endonuclease McrA
MSYDYLVTHKHHIIPRHAGGTDDPSNLIELTVEEHIEAHKELYKKYGRKYDRIAYETMSGHLPYSEARQEAMAEGGKVGAKTFREKKLCPCGCGKKMNDGNIAQHKQKKKCDCGCGKLLGPSGIAAHKKTPEQRKNGPRGDLTGRYAAAAKKRWADPVDRAKRTGRKHTAEEIEKISLALTGQKRTEEQRKNMATAALTRKKHTCKRCGKTMNKSHIIQHGHIL